MRNPVRTAALFLVLVLIGALLVGFGAQRHDRVGEDWTTIVPIGLGVVAIFLGSIGGLRALFSISGHARLRAGRDVLTRWHVGPADWDRFRASDASRAAASLYWLGNPWLRRKTPPGGVEIIFGKDAVIVDDCYQRLRADLRGVNWLAPVGGDPLSCLEFRFRTHPQTSLGGVALRIPVPPSAQGEARRVHDWYQPRLRPREAPALRDPRRTMRACLAAALVFLAMAGVGWALASAGGYRADEEDFLSILPLLLLLTGLIGGLATAILALATFLLPRGEDKRRRR